MRYRLAWVFITVLYLLTRFQNSPGVFTDVGVDVNDTDPYYRLHRIEQIVKGSWIYPLRDLDLSYPNGFDVPWSTGLDELIAFPLKIFHVTENSILEIFSSVAIPLLSLPTLWAVGYVAYVTAGPLAALGAGFLLSVLPAPIYAASVGRLDHHFLESMFTALALAFLAMRKRSKSSRPLIYSALLLGLGPCFWPQAWILCAFVALSFLLDRERNAFEEAAHVFFGAGVLSSMSLLLSDRFFTGYINIFGFSWWTPLVYLVTGLFFLAAKSIRARRFHFSPIEIYSSLFAFAVAIFLFYKNGASFLFGFTSQAIRSSTASEGILSTTSETISPFLFPVWDWPELGLIVLVAGWVWFVLQAFRRDRWWLIGYFLFPLVMSVLQARFIQIATPAMVLGSIYLLFDLSRKIAPEPRYQNIFFGMLVLGLSIPSLPKLELTKKGNQHPLFIPTRQAARFLRERNKQLKIPHTESAIAAHWDLGHWLVYYAASPVVAHPFQDYPTIETLRLFVSENFEDLGTYITKYPVRYLVLETPTSRINTWLKISGKNISDFFQADAGSYATDVNKVKDRFYDLLFARFYLGAGVDRRGELEKNWRLIYISPAGFYGKKGAPALKIFERVPGVLLKAKTARKELTLFAPIQTLEGWINFRQKGTRSKDGFMTWRLPYGRSNSGSVRFDGRISLETSSGESIPVLKLIQDEDVLQGHLIDLGNIR